MATLAPPTSQSGSKLEQTRNQVSISNQSVPGGEGRQNCRDDQLRNELHSCETSLANQSNLLAAPKINGQVAENGCHTGKPNLDLISNDHTDAPTANQVLASHNCGVFSNGSLADPHGSLGNLDELAEGRLRELDQKKLLCGSKRLFN